MSTYQRAKKLSSISVAIALFASSVIAPAQACTGIRLNAMDGTVIHARTMEFAVDIHSDVIVIPRGFVRTGTTPDGAPGLSWKVKYASVGANALGLPVLADGLNEAGLGMGLFYFPTTAGYMPYQPADAPKTVAPWEVGSWLLDNFANVDEVRAAIPNIVVPATILKQWNFSPPVHFVVHDASGKSIVIEYVAGKLNVHDNPLGVMSNSPSFDWHMTNLRNYVTFHSATLHPCNLGQSSFSPWGRGLACSACRVISRRPPGLCAP